MVLAVCVIVLTYSIPKTCFWARTLVVVAIVYNGVCPNLSFVLLLLC